MGTVQTIPSDVINDVVERLAANAEAFCRCYLPNGRRQGRYWHVGDVHGAPGRSLYVRLKPMGQALPANGRIQRPASMVIFSTSSGQAAD